MDKEQVLTLNDVLDCAQDYSAKGIRLEDDRFFREMFPDLDDESLRKWREHYEKRPKPNTMKYDLNLCTRHAEKYKYKVNCRVCKIEKNVESRLKVWLKQREWKYG